MNLGFRGTRTIIVVSCASVTAVLWIIRDLAPAFADYSATLVSVVVTIIAILAPSGQPPKLADVLDQAAAELTAAMVEQWREEEAVRGIDPFPLPVRLSPVSDPDLVVVGGACPADTQDTITWISEFLTGAGPSKGLVVLGGVGAGKSALVLRLTLHLLRQRNDAEPVPVLLAVGAWDPHDDLEDWIAGRLGDLYPALAARATELDGRGRSIARALVAQERVLPILDGLDELAPANRGRALKQLSAAIRRGQRLVLTCRTQEYRDLTDGPDQERLAQTLVVELAPVTPADIRTYLLGTTMPPANRWDPVLTELDTHPGGVLAEVLSTPLMAWLTRTVYKRGHTDPAHLVELATRVDQVRQHLLDGLIPAAYAERSRLSRYPAREGKSLTPVQAALRVLATYLRARNSQNFAWWQLHEAVSRKAIAASVAVATGSLLGAAFGLAVSIKAGLAVGLVAGIANALVAGALCTLTVLSPQELPRVLNFRFSLFGLRYKLLGGLTSGLAVGLTFGYACARGGGLWSAVIVFVVVTPVAIAGVGAVFGLLSGITGGISAGLSFALAAILVDHRSSGVVAGVTTGVVFTVMAWIWTGLYEKTTVTRAVSPDYLYRGDRTSSLVVGVSAGLAYGIAYAFALGPWIGLLGTFALAFAVTLTVSTWGEFVIARLWLSARHKMPYDLMGLLREAHERGVIRQSGTYYQFRHSLLQDRLANATSACEPDAPKASTSGRTNDFP